MFPKINSNIIMAAALAILVFLLLKSCEKIRVLEQNNTRLTENQRQLLNDTAKYRSLKITAAELKNHLPDIGKIVKPERVNSVKKIQYQYIDTSRNTIVKLKFKYDSIKNSFCDRSDYIHYSAPRLWKDSTKCLVIRGMAKIENDSLQVIISERKFNNNTVSVAYLERKQWKFWFIKSRFLGPWQAKCKITDQCGESKMTDIEIVK